MRDGAPFKIALFADLHFGEDAWTEWGPRQDVNSVGVMATVLEKEQPGSLQRGFGALLLSQKCVFVSHTSSTISVVF
ncbi:UNVERIFIED_CONTAM: putative inactive purple acid phosphatase 16 [Sesamum calycinum]|uniref:Inactive purple acid phosphatase 16 n=1 Tax=Sesamum calycinum TaxID=2727403 RepID=A0AAW2SA06_9LAMI